MTNALVLGAGGVKGAFQAGVLSVILQKKEYAPAGIFGSSTGALNGAFLADRAGRQIRAKRRVDWPDIGQQLMNFWKENVTAPHDLWKLRDFESPETWLSILEGKGFLDTEPLKNIILREAKKENLLAAKDDGIHYSPGTVDLFTGKIEYPDSSEPNISDFIFASTAMPLIMPYVEISYGASPKGHFVDGGIRDVAPLRRAIKMGYRKITCIVCQTENLTEFSFDLGNIASQLYRLYEIVFNEIISNDLVIIKQFKEMSKNLRESNQSENIKPQLRRELKSYEETEVEIIRPKVQIEVHDTNFTSDDIRYMTNLGAETAKGKKFVRV